MVSEREWHFKSYFRESQDLDFPSSAQPLGWLSITQGFQERVSMLRRSILSVAERASLLALPDTDDELIRRYAFSEADLRLIRQ